MGCSSTTGPPDSRTGANRVSISVSRARSRIPGSMMTEAACASTSMSALSRLVNALSVVSPAAQKVPYIVPSLNVTGTET
jgi:hypothetical protein